MWHARLLPFDRLRAVSTVEPLCEVATLLRYESASWRIGRENLGNAPVGAPVHSRVAASARSERLCHTFSTGCYARKVFDLHRWAKTSLEERRTKPRIPLPQVWLNK